MLNELKLLHGAILKSLNELDKLTALPQAPTDRLPAARLSLTRASRARTIFLDKMYDQLILQARPERRTTIQALKDEGKANLITSIQHIGTWTLPEIRTRWPEYCNASLTIRSAMRQRIRKEAALIYPLLHEPILAPRASESHHFIVDTGVVVLNATSSSR